MPSPSIWPVPYLIDPTHLAFDELLSFCVSILVAVMINAEGQAYMATFLGDFRPGAKDRLHFNVFLHLDILGTISFFVGGFGWPRRVDIDSSKFKYPRLCTGISRFAGAIANLLMSSIAASIAMVIKLFLDLDSPVFMMLISVNITTAIYNLLPLPPLAAGSLVQVLLRQRFTKLAWYFGQAGPFLILALALGERLTHKAFFSSYLNPLVVAVFNFLTR
jgi:Zn-dependent protease